MKNPNAFPDVREEETRDRINGALASATNRSFLTPYIAWEAASKILIPLNIFLGRPHTLEGVDGIVVLPVDQFGKKMGMTDQGEFDDFDGREKDETHGEAASDGDKHVQGTHEYQPLNNKLDQVGVKDETYHLYFEYQLNEYGMYDVFVEVVTDEELAELEADNVEEDSEES